MPTTDATSLLQDELDLFTALHRPKRLNLQDDETAALHSWHGITCSSWRISAASVEQRKRTPESRTKQHTVNVAVGLLNLR